MKTTTHIHRLPLALSILFTVSFFIAMPTHAYFTTGQEATKLDTALHFTIDYGFGSKKHEINIPILAEQDGAVSTSTVSYSILDEDGVPAKGSRIGIVFSDAPITNKGMYRIKKGIAKKFSLNVLFTPESQDPEKKYRLQVTNLPFNFDGKQQLQLNPSELKYYTTGMIEI